MSARSLVVSIHDVWPGTREAVATMLGELSRIGIEMTSLLVVPDFHHQKEIAGDAPFGSWLRELVSAGHEPVLHGYFHQRERKARETVAARLVTRWYTADEGEFFDIGLEGACQLIERGREEVAGVAGVAPAGFIAPAWLLSRDAEAAARELGFAYTTRLKSVLNLASGEVHFSQSLCWSVRARWRRVVSLGWNGLLFERLKSNRLLRISIHPPDYSRKEIWRQILHLCKRALEDREPVTYGGFISAI